MRQVARVVDHEICSRQALLPRSLRIDASPSIVVRHPPRRDEARHSHINRAVDHHDPVQSPPGLGVRTSLRQERNVQHDDVPTRFGLDPKPTHLGQHTGVNNRLELAPQSRIVEDDLGKRTPVQLPRDGENPVPEPPDNRVKHGLARSLECVHDGVRLKHSRPALGE